MLAKTNGRQNNQGRITVRHRGGGVKRHYRIVTYDLPTGNKYTVREIEYDPNRSARIARIQDQNGTYYYVIADNNMKQGMTFESGKDIAIEASKPYATRKYPSWYLHLRYRAYSRTWSPNGSLRRYKRPAHG